MMNQLLQEVQKQTTGPLEPLARAEVGVDMIQITADNVASASPQVVASSTCLEHLCYSNIVCHVERSFTNTRLMWIIRTCRQLGNGQNLGILGRVLHRSPCLTPQQRWAPNPTFERRNPLPRGKRVNREKIWRTGMHGLSGVHWLDRKRLALMPYAHHTCPVVILTRKFHVLDLASTLDSHMTMSHNMTVGSHIT